MITCPGKAIKHAIVLGGGCAGMLAGKVLSSYVARVTIVERAINPSYRLAQADHIHVLLKQGQIIFDEIFPNTMKEIARHCKKLDWAKDTTWHGPFGQYPQYDSAISTYAFSRRFLDRCMIDEIKQQKNIALLQDVGALVINQEHVAGVQTKRHGYQQADLVIDARGRGSPITRDLSQAGLFLKSMEQVNNDLSYSSCTFRKLLGEKHQVYFQVRPGMRDRGVIVSPIEDDLFLATLIIYGHAPPKTFSEFQSALSNLLPSSIMKKITQENARGSLCTFRNLRNLRRPLGSLKKWPLNLLVMGDAICTLNPVYGQGMTIAAKQALLLAKQCKRMSDGLIKTAKQSQKGIDAITKFPWLMAKIEDQRILPHHALNMGIRFFQTYIDRVLRTSVADKELHHSFIRVMHMLDEPYKLLRPEIVLRTLRGPRQ